jgi:signal transduction histidine kinase
MVSQFERLDFPDAPRSDLERTIDQLVTSAQRVLATQGRLRHLLDANRSVVEELDLEQVLRRIVEAAVSLVNAQYGALGVIAPDGHLEQFIHVGIPDSDARIIGHLPQGHGLLGAVVEAAEPIRLERLSDDHRSSGFPAHHPVMDGFLGVPIRVRSEVYGNLYLTNPAMGTFTQEDEDLVTALAATAGIAIDNARLFDETRRRQRWSAATADVTSALLADDSGDVLGIVADRVASFVDADLVCVVVPGEVDGTLRISTARGTHAAQVTGRVYQAEGTLVGRALSEGLTIAEVALPTTNDWSPVVGPTVAIPLTTLERHLGALTIARSIGGSGFTPAELEMATEFAAQACFAIELARGRTDSVQLELVEDRNRIARDLHDHVIQRLFASGLTLQSLVGRAPAELRDALTEQVDAIDSAIAQIRTAVFTLGSRSTASAAGLRSRILDVVSEMTPLLSSTPGLTFSGPVDLMIEGEFAADVVAVIREGLSNIARHADATESSVDVSIAGDMVIVRIDDDGRGLPEVAHRASGTANLAERAAAYGGDFTMGPRDPRGTQILWRAPIKADG